MCTGFEIFQIAATAYSVSNAISQGGQENSARQYQAEQAQADAVAERESGDVRAEQIRRAGKVRQSEARASLAASGVEVGAGTPLRIDQQIVRNVEADALNQILQGTRTGARLEQDAALARQAGARAEAGGYRSAFGSVLSGGAQLAKGWQSTVRAEQAPAPVEDGRVVRIR